MYKRSNRDVYIYENEGVVVKLFDIPKLYCANEIPRMIVDDIIDAVKTFISKFKIRKNK